MATRPILIFPTPAVAERLKRPSPPPKVHFPSTARQSSRLNPQFGRLVSAFRAHRAALRSSPLGTEPERVLVIESIGSVDKFVSAVRRTPGMEWLGEWDEEDIPADEDFYIEEDHTRTLSGKLYLVMTDQEAIRQLIRFWNRYRRDPTEKFDHGLNKWRDLFRHIRNVRFWDVEDRLDPQLLEFWREQVTGEADQFRFHAELWFKAAIADRERNSASIRGQIASVNGTVLQETVIPEIAYHGVIGQIPRQHVQLIIEGQASRLVRSDQVMFYRAIGQSVAPSPTEEPAEPFQGTIGPAGVNGTSVVGLLDGLPLQNHVLLAGRLVVDDPDGYTANYQAHNRVHGTAMASLLVHGELDILKSPLKRPIYVRPILKPVHDSIGDKYFEHIPDNVDPIDLIHRCVRRMYVSEGGEPAAAPDVRAISFSICDRALPFDRMLSPFARILDFLSWKYNVLFVVSAGNHAHDIELAVPRTQFGALTAQQVRNETIKAIDADAINRRVLSPSESVNALTVASLHLDGSTINQLNQRIDPYPNLALPSPVSPIGSGFKRAIKPEIVYRGGRQLYVEKLGTSHTNATLKALTATRITPGQRVAAPGVAGNLGATRYICGTSNAAALVTREVEAFVETFESLRATPGGTQLLDRYFSLLSKAFLVHGATWNGLQEPLLTALAQKVANRNRREYAARFLGYGEAMARPLHVCSEQRATILGVGDLHDNEAHIFRIPLPPSLSGVHGIRRVTATLSWFSPIVPSHNNYRGAALWFVLDPGGMLIERVEADARQALRGTIQHEIFEGQNAIPVEDGDAMQVTVNCRAAAGKLPETVPYSLVVTLEIAPEINIPLYTEVQTRLTVEVAVAVPPAN